MSFQETLIQLSYFAPVVAFRHHLPEPDPRNIARDIEENWESCKEVFREEWRPLNERALEAYAERLSKELKELYSED